MYSNRVNIFFGGAAAGSVLTYLLDPMSGRRRRKLVGDKLYHASVKAESTSEAAQRDLQNRMRGWVARMQNRFDHEDVDDDVLVERVRAKLGRLSSHPGAIEVTAHQGLVTLKGDVLRDEVDEVVEGVRHVPGVRFVENQMREHDEPDGVPGLQGVAKRREQLPELRQEYWSPATRMAMGTIATMMIGFGMPRRGLPGTALVLGGLALLARAITNLPFSRLFGLGPQRRGVDLHKTFHVNAPPDEVYRFWRHVELYPRFMEHVRAVHPMDGHRSHWTVVGPLGAPIAFDAELTAERPNELLAWKSIGRGPVRHAGLVRFQQENSGTRVDVHMTYNPPLGATGHAIAALLAADPKHALDEDVVRFKSLLEDGKTSAHGQEVRREELVPAIAGSPGAQWEE